jgi:RNA polymerase sigma factor (sigma-70 family)
MNDKTIQIIQRVCKRISEKYTFGYYSKEDIEQEGFLIAMQALPRFNPKISSLETFLYIHISNRLKTFKRDNYLRTDFVCVYCGRMDPECDHCKRREWRHAAKKHLMEPVDIDNVKDDKEKSMRDGTDFLMDVELNEILSIINQNLDVCLREDYLKMVEGIPISKCKKQAIESSIVEILENNGYYRE